MHAYIYTYIHTFSHPHLHAHAHAHVHAHGHGHRHAHAHALYAATPLSGPGTLASLSFPTFSCSLPLYLFFHRQTNIPHVPLLLTSHAAASGTGHARFAPVFFLPFLNMKIWTFAIFQKD